MYLLNFGGLIKSSKTLEITEIRDWVASNEIIHVDYPDNIEDILVNEVLTF